MLRFVTVIAACAAALSSFTAPASAGTYDVSTLTCQELVEALGSQDSETALGGAVIMSWFSGYHATEEQGTVIDFDAVGKDGEKLIDFCAANPNIGAMTAAAKFMGENATPAGAEAVDLSTVTCSELQNPAENPEGAGVVFMWLAGYYASYNEDTVLDLDALTQAETDVYTTCQQSAELGLVTVAKQTLYTE